MTYRSLCNLGIVLVLIFSSVSAVLGQNPDNTVVQFSGIVMTDEHGDLEPLPYVNVYIQATRRGTFTGSDGFFSLV